MGLRILLTTIALVLASGTLLLNLLTIVPILVYRLWPYSLGAIELSLWIGLAGFVGALLAFIALQVGSSTAGRIALVCGLLAFGLGIIPPLRARTAALQEGVRLSASRYFFGWRRLAPAVDVRRDIVYGQAGGEMLHLNMYQSVGVAQGRRPAMVIIHGGSWSGGAKGELDRFSRAMAGEGLVVADIDYRLAGPNRRFPTQVGDVKCAIGWIKQNADAYHIDPARIVLVGRSAGGQLALLAAYTPGNPALQPSCPAGDTTVSAVIAYYAPVDQIWGYTHPAKPDLINGAATLRTYLGGTPDSIPDAYRLASPHLQVTSQSPPTLIIHGGHDRLVGVQHAYFLREALERTGIPNRLVVLPWADHGFDFFFDGWGSQITQPIIHDFLDAYVRGSRQSAHPAIEQDHP
jgi:acetyl esterase/lipase